MIHNKLVRDKIPQIILDNGDTPITHIATDEEYEKHLKLKLQEEVDEFLAEPCVEELADILEVIDAIKYHYKFNNLEKVKKEKQKKRGGFKKKIILKKTN